MTPSDYGQSEYVRGIYAGKRIERQRQTVASLRDVILYFVVGVGWGWLLF